jgi:pilus assembly protein Flp/PilA
MMEFLRNESGATAVEYSLIATIVAIGLLAAFPALSSGISYVFTSIAGRLASP